MIVLKFELMQQPLPLVIWAVYLTYCCYLCVVAHSITQLVSGSQYALAAASTPSSTRVTKKYMSCDLCIVLSKRRSKNTLSLTLESKDFKAWKQTEVRFYRFHPTTALEKPTFQRFPCTHSNPVAKFSVYPSLTNNYVRAVLKDLGTLAPTKRPMLYNNIQDFHGWSPGFKTVSLLNSTNIAALSSSISPPPYTVVHSSSNNSPSSDLLVDPTNSGSTIETFYSLDPRFQFELLDLIKIYGRLAELSNPVGTSAIAITGNVEHTSSSYNVTTEKNSTSKKAIYGASAIDQLKQKRYFNFSRPSHSHAKWHKLFENSTLVTKQEFSKVLSTLIFRWPEAARFPLYYVYLYNHGISREHDSVFIRNVVNQRVQREPIEHAAIDAVFEAFAGNATSLSMHTIANRLQQWHQSEALERTRQRPNRLISRFFFDLRTSRSLPTVQWKTFRHYWHPWMESMGRCGHCVQLCLHKNQCIVTVDEAASHKWKEKNRLKENRWKFNTL